MRHIRWYIAGGGVLRSLCGKCLFASVILAFSAIAQGAELVVSAAASLTDAFREVGRSFEAAHPGTAVVFNFAATDVLLAQIAKGAPVDVFAAADEESMDRAEREGLLVRESRRDFAANRLVLIVPARAPSLSKLDEIRLSRFGRIAVGSPRTVPAGRYAKAALERAKLWDAIEARCVFALNVRQVLDYVARGEADAGFVYATDAALMPEQVKVALDVPTPAPVRYPTAVVRATHHEREARVFVDGLFTEPSRKIMAAYGFSAP